MKRTLTEEQREAKRLKDREHYRANKQEKIAKVREYVSKNKEKISERRKAYRDANRERIAEYKKAYRQANKEKIVKENKEYYKANKEKISVKAVAYRESKTLCYSIIYCIPNYDGKGGNYAGVTNNPTQRMRQHKSLGKLNTADWFVLDIVVDRAEAFDSESKFHSQGYHGDKEETKLRRAA